MRNNIHTLTLLLAAACWVAPATAPPAAAGERRASKGNYAAYRLLKRGTQLLESGEEDRGTKMLLTLIEQHPKSPIRFAAYLALGRFNVESRNQEKAIEYLRAIRRIAGGNREPEGKDLETYIESLYLTGVAHYQLRQYGAAFSVLRRITGEYPTSQWANEAYYYIGMSHFAQSHWNRAVEALEHFGAVIDPESDALAYVEAGHRFHVRIKDGDLPVLNRLGRKITVSVTTAGGDEETIPCEQGTAGRDLFIGAIPTAVGMAKKNDGTIQVLGGDTIRVRYRDDNTKEGKKDVIREKEVEVVSTGGITFTLSTYDSLAPAAYIGQPLSVRLWDLDRDTGGDADSVTLHISTRYTPKEKDIEDDTAPPMTVDIDALDEEEREEKQVIRDEVTVTLSERGTPPVRSGIFLGAVDVVRAETGTTIDRTDNALAAAVGDTITAVYVDERHINGTAPIEITARLTVAGEISSAPRASQDVVTDPVVRSKKKLVEAEAYLELAKIFKDMGLLDGAKKKAGDGLTRVEEVIREREGVPAELKENAFRIKWELHLAENEFRKAMSTCRTFSRLYPESSMVDKALMGMGEALLERKDYEEAITVLRQVVRLPNSHAKARAQFLIARARENTKRPESSIRDYLACAKRFPDSEYAGKSLAKVIDYQIKSNAMAEANDLLRQVFVDYQDEDFLDSMLLKWVLVSYRMGDYAGACEKCERLIAEYPGSKHAAKAEQILPRIRKVLTGDTDKKDKKEEHNEE